MLRKKREPVKYFLRISGKVALPRNEKKETSADKGLSVLLSTFDPMGDLARIGSFAGYRFTGAKTHLGGSCLDHLDIEFEPCPGSG